MNGTCLDCGQPGDIEARGLDSRCYRARKRNGSLHERPLLGRSDAAGLADSPLTVGLTYRQLDFWTRRGYLQADNPAPGSGRRRTWPATERAVAALMLRLTAAGLTLEAAHRAARAGGRCELAPGIRIEVAA